MQEKVESFDTPPPNYNSPNHATHGFSQRPSIAQIIAYIVISASVGIYFSSTLSLGMFPAVMGVYIGLGLIMVVSSAGATLINPTDRVVYYYKWSRYDRKVIFAPEYDKILFCEFCDSYCWANSKHCRTCNRCVNRFDHHCMWFNNCVGQRNYRWFFLSIVSTFFYAVTILVHTSLVTFQVDFSNGNQLIRIVLSWIIATVMAVFAFLLLNLIILHIYLFLTDQTTYQFLQRRKREEQQEKAASGKEQRRIVLGDITKRQEEHPEGSKPPQLASEQSIANTKFIFVQGQKQPESEPPRTRRRGKQRQVSNDYFEQQLAKHSRKDKEEEKTVKSNKEEENDPTIIQEEEEVGLEQSKDKLPKFLRKNRSIKLLLSGSEAETPSKKKLNQSSQAE